MPTTKVDNIYSYVNMILLSVLSGMAGLIVLFGAWWGSRISHKLEEAVEVSKGLTEWAKGHDKQDDSRHIETNNKLDRNQDSTHDLRNQVSDFALKVGVQTRRINKRDDDYGVGS